MKQAPLKASKSILIIGRHEALQDTRTLILGRAGYQVYDACNDQEAISRLENPEPLDLVILCHSVAKLSKDYLVERTRSLRPGLPILLLSNGFYSTAGTVDGCLHSLDSPDAMLKLVGKMTRGIAVKFAC
jgi:DNA-binding response OmpR family regulator